ncbi:hypothetical protein ACFL1I_01255 [Candidatus Omnitrophota bacterium]
MKRLLPIIIVIYFSLFCLGCATLKESKGDSKEDMGKLYYDFRHFLQNLTEHTMVIKDLDRD